MYVNHCAKYPKKYHKTTKILANANRESSYKLTKLNAINESKENKCHNRDF